MTELPPRPDDRLGVPSPRPAPPRRPGMVTAAGILLLVAGAMGIVGGVVILGGGELAMPGISGESASWLVLTFFTIGILEALAGWLVLRLSQTGRILGIVLASVLVVADIVQLGRSGSPGLLTLALYAFVLYGLLAYGFVFKERSAAR